MTKTGGNPRIHDQSEIVKRWGRERIDEATERLCQCCCFHLWRGGICPLLPISSDGKDCSYFSLGDQYPKEVERNG